MIIGSNKYSILTNNGTIDSNVDFDRDQIAINYTKLSRDTDGKDFFMADIKTVIEVSYTYVGFKGELIPKKIRSNLTLTLFEDEGLKLEFESLYKQFEEIHLLKNELSWWDYATLDYDMMERYKMFEIYNDFIREGKLRAYYRSQKFQNLLNENLTHEQEGLKDAKLVLDKADILDDTLLGKITPNKDTRNYENAATSNGDKPGAAGLHSSLFKRIQRNIGTTHFHSSPDDQILIDRAIFDLLNWDSDTGIRNGIKTYQEQLQEHFANDDLDEMIQRENFANGKVSLQDVSLEIQDGYSVNLNTVNMEWILATSTDKVDVDKEINQTYLGEAIFFNTDAGIKAFQDVWVTREYGNTIQNAELGNPRVFMVASGAGKTGKDIWNYLKSDWQLNNVEQHNNLNNILSLQIDELSDKRQQLLTSGYQGVFNLLIWGVDTNNVVQFDKSISNYTISGEKNFNQLVHESSSGEVGKIAFNLKLNF
ncbi:hypothetical protein SCLARK_001387 [Spiroplasma clarkii]|uniref:hypothetical protein n=1 Tax=Spiroplasma clarkii TaxID=2139 RepID=UPI000B552E3E|nr:hypothetical protein [Spiroplasma clarkii]ARU91914.1 hypothetical protein SCLARK_001387 [Spiroplasma clarkii]